MQKILVVFLLNSTLAIAAPLAGKINNKPFKFVSGTVKKNGDNYQFALWTESFPDACQRWQGSTLDVRMIFPATVGKYKVIPNSWDQNVIVMGDNTNPGTPESNIVADKGSLEIVSINDVEVHGVVTGELNWMKSKISGEFSATICP